jgi:hypothetical protein
MRSVNVWGDNEPIGSLIRLPELPMKNRPIVAMPRSVRRLAEAGTGAFAAALPL